MFENREPKSQELADALERLRSRGWTEDDLRALEKRHRNESDQFLIALLHVLPPLPPLARSTGDADERVLAKVRALLAKAESTTFPAEAEAYSAKAQELMTRYRIDGVCFASDEASLVPAGRRIWVDSPYVSPKVAILRAVARANGCRAVEIGRMGCVHVIGYERDLELVEMLFTSLLVQVGVAIAEAGTREDRFGRSRTRSFRSSFLLGYAWRVGERLIEVNGETEEKADAERGGDLLPVLRRRDDAVASAVAETFPNLSYGRASEVSNHQGWASGVAAADRARFSVSPGVGSGHFPSALGR